ncbi:hypothetical protein L2E82_10021 [Cichorium intybus]|uniref:Uncharacterized protein n=1 Tax=Cichorium intybus TaxID=13427 RepID=A0ACB9G936_CICIN|nr:hypothetical protein L2E82_10021 [Cichorium intybus]
MLCRTLLWLLFRLYQQVHSGLRQTGKPKEGGKRKGKGSTSDTVKPAKSRKKPRKAKIPTPLLEDEESKDQTQSRNSKGNQRENEEEEDTGNIGQKPLSHPPTSPPKLSPKPTPKNTPSPSPKNSPKPTPKNSPPSSPKNTTNPSPKQTSPLPCDEEEILYYDEQDDLTTFIQSPFNIYFHPDDEGVLDAHKTSVETLINENEKVLEDLLKLIEASEKQMTESTETVEKLKAEVFTFVQDFRIAHDTNTASLNKNSDLASSLDAKLDQLRKDLAMENEVMDKLAARTSMVKVLKANLNNTSEKLVAVNAQNTAIKSCVSDADAYLRRLVEEGDSILTTTVRHHLTNKLHPVHNLLGKIKGVSKSGATPKQGGDENEANPSKPTITTRDSKEAREARDKELNELDKLRRELEAKEVADRDATETLEARKALFPAWLFGRMKKELFEESKVYWLEPVCSFDVDNIIHEVAKLDAEVATLLKASPLVKAERPPSDLKQQKIGIIEKDPWSVAYSSKEGAMMHKKMFYLVDKHLQRTAALEHIVYIVNKNVNNSVPDKNYFSAMINWYLSVRKVILKVMPRVFKTTSSEPKTKE